MRLLVDGGSAGSGGYVHHLRGVLNARPPTDLDVTLLCSPRLADRLGPLGEHVRVARHPELDDPRPAARLRWWNRRFPALVREARPDVLLHPRGFLRGRAGPVPRAVVHHNISPFCAETYRLYGVSLDSARYLATRAAMVRGMRRADGVAFVHEVPRDVVTSQVAGIRRHTVVANCTPAEYLDAVAPVRQELPAQVQVLCVATQYMSKYPWNVVHGVAEARERTGLDLRLRMVGGGDRRTGDRLRAAIRARRADQFVTVHDDVPEQGMPAFYAGADLFVFPSTQECFPVTLLEAMASGLPIACSDRMAMPRILRDAGVYFDPTDPVSLCRALERLLADGGLRVRAGHLAQVYAREYQWQREADRLFAFLRDLAAEAPRRRGAPVLAGQATGKAG